MAEIDKMLLDEFALRLHISHKAIRSGAISAALDEAIDKVMRSLHNEGALVSGRMLTSEDEKRRLIDRYYQRKNAGLCPVCGGSRTDNHITCTKCRMRARNKAREARKINEQPSNP